MASVGKLGGVVPYTSYSARISYLDSHKETIQKFTRAIQKGLDYVHSHTDEEVADEIIDFFPDTSKEDLIDAIGRYREADSWAETTTFTKESFDHLQDIMIASNELKEKVPFEELMYQVQ